MRALTGWARPGRTKKIRTENVTLLSVVLMCVAAFLASSASQWSTVALLSVAAIVVSLRIPEPRLPDLLAVAVSAWAYLTTLGTNDMAHARGVSMLYVSACILFLAARHVAISPLRLIAVGFSYIAGCTVSAGQLIFQAWGVSSRSSELNMGVRFGLDGTNINFTAYSSVTAIVLALCLLRTQSLLRPVKYCLIGAMPILAYGIFLNRTKGALSALLLIVAYLVFSRARARVAWLVAAVGTPLLLVAVPLGIGQSGLTWADDVIGSQSTGDVVGRVELWSYALHYWSERFWLGAGAGTFELWNPLGDRPHNAVLGVAVDLGLIGLLMVAALFASSLTTLAARGPAEARTAGLFLVATFPMWLTGVWEFERGPWLAVALLSALPFARTVRPAESSADGVRLRPAMST